MRAALTAIALASLPLAVAAPAAAKDAPPSASASAEALQERLTDPAEQERLATMLTAMGEALLQMPVGPLLDAANKAGGKVDGDIPADATLGDLAGPNAKAMPSEIAAKLPMLMQMMGGMAKSLESMKPMLEQMGKQWEQSAKDAGAV